MSRQKKEALFRFPMRGVHRTAMKVHQPEGTCFDALNVRPFDTIEDRARGGSRPGLKKYSSARGSANRVQDLNKVTTISSSLQVGSLSRRTITPVQVTDGVIAHFNTTAVNNATVAGSQALGNAAQSPFAFSTESFGQLYFADGFGYKVYNHTNTTAYDWSPTAGSLPGDEGNNVVCRLIESWRGRIVLSGLASDPHNWFMSKLGDPLDFDFAPAVETEIDAVTGGSGFVGKAPDIVNAIIPYTDDVLIFGCDHSIWMLDGDPQSGGRFVLVTNTVGMSFGRPYTQLPDGTLMFFSNRGSVYRMAPGGGKPVNITEKNIDPLITNTDLNTNIVKMAYDEQIEGVHMWISPLTAGNTTHWFYDIRNDGWFRVQYGDNNYNPVATMIFEGDLPADRVILLGGEDGYVRQYSDGQQNDDGNTFTTFAIMGPVVEEEGRKPCVLSHVQFIMDDTSTNTIYEIGAGDTAELALDNFASTFTGETDEAGNTIIVPAGKSRSINPRERGYFIYFKVGTVAANTQWAIEYIHSKWAAVTTSPGHAFQFESGLSFSDPDAPPILNSSFLWAAYWAYNPDLTFTGSNATVWAPRQLGTNTTKRNLIPVTGDAGPTLNSSDTKLGGQASLFFQTGRPMEFNTATASGEWAADETENNQWFITVAFITEDGPQSSGAKDAFILTNSENGSERYEIEIDDVDLKIGLNDTLGTTHESSNSIVVNTPYIMTFGASKLQSRKALRVNGGDWLEVNVSFGIPNETMQFTIKDGPQMRIGAIAFYFSPSSLEAWNTDIINSVEASMANYFNITLV